MASPAGPAAGSTPPRVGPVARRLTVFAVVAVAAGLGAQAGAWWIPFPAGVMAGFASAGLPGISPRGLVLSAVSGAVVGWAIPLWVLALRGLPAGATARTIAGLAGLPPYAAVTVLVTLLLAALQVLAGAWLARAFAPRR
jgi:hypothetical protein